MPSKRERRKAAVESLASSTRKQLVGLDQEALFSRMLGKGAPSSDAAPPSGEGVRDAEALAAVALASVRLWTRAYESTT